MRLVQLISLMCVVILGFAHIAHADDAWDSTLTQLESKSFSVKTTAVKALSESDHPQAMNFLEAIANNRLVLLDEDHQWYIAQSNNETMTLTSLNSKQVIENVDASLVTPFVSNNQLRLLARKAIAMKQLKHTDEAVRLQAARFIRQAYQPDFFDLVVTAKNNETDAVVLRVLNEIIDIEIAQQEDDEPARLAAIERLGKSLSIEAKNTLEHLLQKNDDGTYALENKTITQTAEKSLTSLSFARQLNAWFENAFFGLSMASVLLLAAVGLAITFGVMGVINMAHGEMMMIGAYTAFVMQQIMPNFIGSSLLIAIPTAFLCAALVGIVIERLVIRHLYGRPLETLLATFGISLLLQQLARTIFSPLNKEVATPEMMSGALQVNDALSLTYNRLFIILGAVIVFLVVLYVMKKTRFGLQVRAVMQNRPMAQAMGINTARIDMLTFGFGSGIAGIAGVALSQLTNVGPNLGQAFIVDSFMVVVFGGVGNLWGTLVAAITLGELNKFLEPAFGAVLAKVLLLVLIILFIQKRPRGLFPQKGREVS